MLLLCKLRFYFPDPIIKRTFRNSNFSRYCGYFLASEVTGNNCSLVWSLRMFILSLLYCNWQYSQTHYSDCDNIFSADIKVICQTKCSTFWSSRSQRCCVNTNFRTLRGLALINARFRFSVVGLTLNRFLPFGWSSRNRLLQFSLLAFCQAQYGSAKYTSQSNLSSISLQSANSVPLSQVMVLTSSGGNWESVWMTWYRPFCPASLQRCPPWCSAVILVLVGD